MISAPSAMSGRNRRTCAQNSIASALECRYSTGSIGLHELAKAKAEYARLAADNAHRLLRFWQVKSAPH